MSPLAASWSESVGLISLASHLLETVLAGAERV